MADKVDKPKKQKPKAKPEEKGVLAALPSTRPERIGTRRSAGAPAPKSTAATAASKAAAASAKPAAKQPARKAAAAKPRAAAAKKAPARTKPAAAKPRATAARRKAAKPRATAARRKAAAPRTFEPTQAAEAAAGAVRLGETPPVREERTYPRPRPVREGAPGIGTPGYRDDLADESGRPGGVELAATAVRAAGEVAQLGLSIGGAVVKGVAKRLPKP